MSDDILLAIQPDPEQVTEDGSGTTAEEYADQKGEGKRVHGVVGVGENRRSAVKMAQAQPAPKSAPNRTSPR